MTKMTFAERAEHNAINDPAEAQVWATLAVAEQMERIADALYAKSMFKEDSQYSIAELAQALQRA